MKTLETIGPYTLVSPLGDAARGNVWRARAGSNGGMVALKLVRAGQIEARARLLYEVDMALAFDHPNIVRMYECGEADGVTWVTMAYVAGPQGALTLANFRQLLLAMVHVHANDVVHADIRMANLLLDEFGDVRLTGFALARRRDDSQATAPAPRLMSPEQLRGQAIDVRTDIFAAGAVLYQVLTGKPPFAGSAFDMMQQILQDSQAAPSEAAPGLGTSFDEVVRRALAREKEDRIGSAFEFLSAFDSACRRGVRPPA